MSLGLAQLERGSIGATADAGELFTADPGWQDFEDTAGRKHRETIIVAPPTNGAATSLARIYMKLWHNFGEASPETFQMRLWDFTNSASVGTTAVETVPTLGFGEVAEGYWWGWDLTGTWTGSEQTVGFQFLMTTLPDHFTWWVVGGPIWSVSA